MKAHLLKALKQIPKTITTAATTELKNRAAYIPLKAQLHIEDKIQSSISIITINHSSKEPQQHHNQI